jgi:hypothetical protein
MTSRIIESILTHSQETKSFIGVRKNNDESELWIGYIVDFNEQIFVLQHISPLGFQDGLIIERIDAIDNFEINDDMLKTIELLYNNNLKILNQNTESIEISTDEKWQFELIKGIIDNGKIVSIELNNSDIVNYGYIVDYDDTILQIIAINRQGMEDGTQTYNLSDITSFGIDRIEGRKREILFELGNSKKK